MPNKQLPLFQSPGAKPRSPESGSVNLISEDAPTLTAGSTLSAAIAAYYEHMRQQGLSPYTIQAFNGDLNLFRRYIGSNFTLAEISTDTLNKFLRWLRYERGVPCKPKSYQRRLTTLKVFFSWLVKSQVLLEDPAAPIAHQPVSSPLPEILHSDQVDKLLQAARDLRHPPKNDPRPYLLFTLLLATGVKKSEAMALRLIDLDISDPRRPILYIRYDDARKRHKERKLRLPADFVEVLAEYRQTYSPAQRLFECTPRNLEYVLADLAQATGLGETVSFESLRWTCAVRDYEGGMSEDHIRLKLGLSTITWEEAGERLRRLAGKPL